MGGEGFGTNPPQAATIGASTRLTLAPTPPVECLSSTVPEPAISRVSVWLNYGEREYGETYSQALEGDGLRVRDANPIYS